MINTEILFNRFFSKLVLFLGVFVLFHLFVCLTFGLESLDVEVYLGVVQLGETLVFVLGLRVLANWLVKLFG